jgi:sialate O-acetylesterase
MIAPLAGYAIRGAVWYQGETNTAYPREYRDVLASLVTSWRRAWGQGEFPFVVIQLPNFIGRDRDWPTMRASQAHVARDLPNVGLVVTIDVGESRDIHPRDKLTVGDRAALVAQKLAYGRDVVHGGPVLKSSKIDGGEVILAFADTAGGLVAKGGTPRGFEIAGADGKFVAADAKLDGDTVRLNAAGVALPKLVRYGWANDPVCTLYNAAGLPAAPFTTQPDVLR